MAKEPNVHLHEALPPDLGGFSLNTCGNPDCENFGALPGKLPHHRPRQQLDVGDLVVQPAKYVLKGTSSGSDDGGDRAGDDTEQGGDDGAPESRVEAVGKKVERTPFKLHHLECGVCGSRQSLQSNVAFHEEVLRLLGEAERVASGPICPACDARYMDPERQHEFKINGMNGKGVRLMHVCKDDLGQQRRPTRFTYTPAHRKQNRPQENLEILQKLINRSGFNGILRAMSTGRARALGVSRLYDRVFWLEKQLLAYERAQWIEFRSRTENAPFKEHRLAFDTADISVNWETSEDRRNTIIKCNVTADVESGFILRADAAFDGDIDPVRFFIEHVGPKSGNRLCGVVMRGRKQRRYPLRHYQRPTARFDERLFYPAALHHVAQFMERVVDRMDDPARKRRLLDEGRRLYRTIRRTYVDYYGIGLIDRKTRAPFMGAVVSYNIALAAHLEAVRQLLQPAKITLYTDANTTAVRYVPHVFREEIRRDWFTWAAVYLVQKNLSLQKRQQLVSENRKLYREWFESRGFNGPFSSYKREFVMDFMTSTASPHNAFDSAQLRRSPWVNSPLSTMYEPSKIVGVLIPPRRLRQTFKDASSTREAMTVNDGMSAHEKMVAVNARRSVAEIVEAATLQPVDAFFNSLRSRLSHTERAAPGAGRSSGTYIRGNLFNPRVLVALLNIYRVSYNFFELRPYEKGPIESMDGDRTAKKPRARRHRVAWSDEMVEVTATPRRLPVKLSPAMRYGIHERPGPEERPKVDLVSILSTPWEVYGTPLFDKLTNRRTDLRKRRAAAIPEPE